MSFGSPAQAAVQHLLSDALDDASTHVTRLADLGDGEAVHDFRVAVRRLRTFLRAFSGILTIDDRIQVELRDLTSRTNATRDAEAHSEWLHERLEHPGLNPEARQSVARVLAHLAGRTVRPEGLEDEARRVLSRTRRALAQLDVPVQGAQRSPSQTPEQTFGQATAGVLDHEARRLRKRLGRIENLNDTRRLHRARLSEKRLRYVLERVAGQVDGADAPVQRLKNLQDLLGELHDLSSLRERLTDTESELHDLVRRRRDELFEALQLAWLGIDADTFFNDIARITEILREEPSSASPT